MNGLFQNLDEKIRCEKLEMDSLKSKVHEMLKTGHQNNAVAETQEVFNKFDNISDKVKVSIKTIRII